MMQARNIFVWGLTPIILLLGLWLETKDRPAEPVRAIVQGPGSSFTPDLEVAAEPIVEALTPPPATEYLDYWDYEEMWDDKRRDMLKLHFKDWEKTQEGVKVRVIGTVEKVEARDYWDKCLTGIRQPGIMGEYMAQFMPCDVMREFNKGDSITLNCVMGDDGIISPDVEECVVQ